MIKMNIFIDDLGELLAYLETTSLEPHDDYTSEFTYKEQKILYEYITKLENDKTKLQNNWNELNKFIEEEKNRLATQVSNTYKDSLDKIHFVNEDIFNELTKVSGKMQELERGKE